MNIVRALYRKPVFVVEELGETSNRYEQQTGIRQGCPHSPYIFLLIMAALFEDVKQYIVGNVAEENKPRNNRALNVNFNETSE